MDGLRKPALVIGMLDVLASVFGRAVFNRAVAARGQPFAGVVVGIVTLAGCETWGPWVALASLIGLAVMAYRTELFSFGTKSDVVATLGVGLAGVVAVTPLLIAGGFAVAMVMLGAAILFMLLAIAFVWFLRQVFRR
jgi:hypothetical protein